MLLARLFENSGKGSLSLISKYLPSPDTGIAKALVSILRLHSVLLGNSLVPDVHRCT